MTKLFSNEEFLKAKPNDYLPLLCESCNKSFLRQRKVIIIAIAKQIRIKNSKPGRFCSYKCFGKAMIKPKIKLKCQHCNIETEKTISEIKKNPNHFCSRSCAALYNNTHKTHGSQRSKLEKYIELKLTELYPNLGIHYNRKDAINSELDIYIPFLKLAFELNGIFHYEPIYGEEKLKYIKNNDNRKYQACLERGIELCIIDSSKFNNFKLNHANEFLKIVTDLIDSKFKSILKNGAESRLRSDETILQK